MKNSFVTILALFLLSSNLFGQADALAPAWLSYISNTNLGVRDVCSDCAGNVVYVGGTSATAFQGSPGTINPSYLGGNSDAFIVKVDSTGKVLWSTLLGGPQYDRAYAVEVDRAGFIYVAGRAGNGLQTTECALQQNFAGDNDLNTPYGVQDGFVTKITPDGTQIVWSTYLGCTGRGFIRDIDLDAKGNIWAAVSTASPNFPYISANAVQPTATYSRNPALVKLSADGKNLLFGTFLADGVNDGGPTTVRVDQQDHVYFLSHASANKLPVTSGVFQPTAAGDVDFVLSKFDSTGQLVFCSFLGGSGKEEVETHSLEIDAAGNAIVAAYTFSADYPVVGNVLQNTFKGSRDGVITKIAADGSAILASTYLGGSQLDEIEGVGIDANDVIYVSGTTASPDFPVTSGTAYQSTKGGAGDGHLTVVSADLSTILYATFAGGNGTDQLRTCHVDARGIVHAGGASASANYPVYNAFHPALTGTNTGVAVSLRPHELLPPGPACTIINGFIDPCLVVGTVDAGQPDIFVFPNPASASLFVESTHPGPLQRMELIDLNGRLLLSKVNVGAGQHIDVSQLARGTYFLKVVSERGAAIQKLLLQ